MTNELRTAWNNLDSFGQTRLVNLSVAPVLTLLLVSNQGLDLIDVLLVLSSVSIAAWFWLKFLIDRRDVRAAQSRQQILDQIDREIAALGTPVALSKD